MSIQASPRLLESIDKVRSDTNSLEWTVAHYTSRNQLDLLASGTEGTLESAASAFPETEAAFALIRYPLQVDRSSNVRFAFIDWTPDLMQPMKKALVSVHKGQIRSLFDPFHVDLICSDRTDIDETVLLKRIGVASGTYDLVVDDARKSQLRDASRANRKEMNEIPTDFVPKSHSTDQVSFSNDLKRVLDDVRNDLTVNTWTIAGYTGESTVGHLRSGEGGLDDMLNAMDEDKVQFALGRFEEVIDEKAKTVKFVFVSQMPVSVSPMKRGRYSTYSGSIRSFFKPFHFEFSVGSASELSSELITEHAAGYTGTRSREVDPVKRQVKQMGVSTNSFLKGSTVNFADGEENRLKSAINAVQDDGSETHWVLACLGTGNTVEMIDEGEGGYDEFKHKIREDTVNFGVLRVTDKIDRSVTVKFVYILFVPEDMPPMRRARFGTMSGAVQDLFRPVHVDLTISSVNELTHSDVLDRVGVTSGSKSRVVRR